jgi:hypothetical protein
MPSPDGRALGSFVLVPLNSHLTNATIRLRLAQLTASRCLFRSFR